MLPEVSAAGRISGYASLYHVRDHDGDVVLPGAFDASLREWKSAGRFVPILWQHNMAQPIGIWTHFKSDARGQGARQLVRIKLYEVSLVTFPALEGARVSAVKKFPVRL